MPQVPPPLRSSADIATSMGAAVRARRRALGLTQEDVADLADVGLRLVHAIEHDSDTVQLNNLLRVLYAVGLHLRLGPGAGDGDGVVVPSHTDLGLPATKPR